MNPLASPLLTVLPIISSSPVLSCSILPYPILSAHQFFPTRLRSSVFVFAFLSDSSNRYGKRKYNPSGRIEGDYNGMGQSDSLRIEIARVQKEEIELRKQRRLLEEEAKSRK